MRHLKWTLSALCFLGQMGLMGCSDTATVPVTGAVYGIVVNPDGTRADGARVVIEGGGDSLIDEDLDTYTNARGEFVINGVLSVDEESIGKLYNIRGEAQVEAYIQNELRYVSAGFIREDFSVPGQQSYDMGTLVLQETATYWGKILLEDKDEYDGDHSGSFISIDGFSFQAVTQSNGYYYLTKLPPHDNYIIICEREGYRTLRVGPIIVRRGIRTQGGAQNVLERLDD